MGSKNIEKVQIVDIKRVVTNEKVLVEPSGRPAPLVDLHRRALVLRVVEVDEDDAGVVHQQHVRGLDVAVQRAVLVQVRERGRHVVRDDRHALPREALRLGASFVHDLQHRGGGGAI